MENNKKSLIENKELMKTKEVLSDASSQSEALLQENNKLKIIISQLSDKIEVLEMGGTEDHVRNNGTSEDENSKLKMVIRKQSEKMKGIEEHESNRISILLSELKKTKEELSTCKDEGNSTTEGNVGNTMFSLI